MNKVTALAQYHIAPDDDTNSIWIPAGSNLVELQIRGCSCFFNIDGGVSRVSNPEINAGGREVISLLPHDRMFNFQREGRGSVDIAFFGESGG